MKAFLHKKIRNIFECKKIKEIHTNRFEYIISAFLLYTIGYFEISFGHFEPSINKNFL